MSAARDRHLELLQQTLNMSAAMGASGDQDEEYLTLSRAIDAAAAEIARFEHMNQTAENHIAIAQRRGDGGFGGFGGGGGDGGDGSDGGDGGDVRAGSARGGGARGGGTRGGGVRGGRRRGRGGGRYIANKFFKSFVEFLTYN